MLRPLFVMLSALLISLPLVSAGAQAPKTDPKAAGPKAADPAVAAVVETTLKTEFDPKQKGGNIRQFAFDGDANTYFGSASNPTTKDHVTLVLDKAVTVKSINVQTGKPAGGDTLEEGTLEVSADGKTFETLEKFKDGSASAKPNKSLKAIRIKPTADLKHPLAVREFALESEPPVRTFKYPVEFIAASESPEMTEWIEKVGRICEYQYFMVNEELKSDGFKPLKVVKMTLKNNYKGVAAAGGGQINGSVDYFKKKQDDIGAMVHETCHIVQQYRGKGNPGWLVEGVADYVRFFKYEPGKIGKINPNTAKYNASYRVTAAFLNYSAEKYDKELVRKLNKAMREGDYKEELFKLYTKKTAQELDTEWRAALKEGKGLEDGKGAKTLTLHPQEAAHPLEPRLGLSWTTDRRVLTAATASCD